MGKVDGFSRRRVLATGTGGLAGALTGTAALAAAPAQAAVSYAPGSYPATKVLSPADRHLVSRFSYGVTPELTAQVLAAGGAAKWAERQVAAAYVANEKVADWWPDLRLDPVALYLRDRRNDRSAYRMMLDYGKRLLMRRILTPNQVREVLTEFWETHLHVPASDDNQFVWRAAYGEMMRRNALSSYETILYDAITHPAMLIYLDNAGSTASRPNENLARELLELHTVGIGAFDEDDVKDSARILTGWRVSLTTLQPEYAAADHATGPVSVMGFADPNASTDGRDMTRRYLAYLARHPLTAQRIATKLATKFVSDTPSRALVDSLARAYLANGTRIVPVLQVLVASAEFQASTDAKLRDPSEDVVATHRVLGTTVAPPASADDSSAANSIVEVPMTMGPAPMAWPRPDGAPIDNGSWSSPARVMASFQAHWMMAGAWWPTNKITYRTRASWIPRYPITFRDLVDHLSRSLHGRVSTPILLQACCEATGIAPTTSITKTHRLATLDMPKLLAVFLDHPAHLHR